MQVSQMLEYEVRGMGERQLSQSGQPPSRPAQCPRGEGGKKRDDWCISGGWWGPWLRHREQLLWSRLHFPYSLSNTLFYFLFLLQFQKRILLKPGEGGWWWGETRRGNPLVRLHQCMCESVYVEAAEVALQSQGDFFPPPWGEYDSE